MWNNVFINCEILIQQTSIISFLHQVKSLNVQLNDLSVNRKSIQSINQLQKNKD